MGAVAAAMEAVTEMEMELVTTASAARTAVARAAAAHAAVVEKAARSAVLATRMAAAWAAS